METKIKICGTTSVHDARLALSMGADYVGLIFAESPRRINIATATEIRAALPTAMLVGVFHDNTADGVVETVRKCNLDMVQLHGSETPEYCEDIHARANVPIIKAFKEDDFPDTHRLGEYETTSFFLFDLKKNQVEDSSLRSRLDEMWDGVSRTRRQGFRVFLAGALCADNVRHAIAHTSPYGIDVCRGVERKPGVKDPAKLESFILEARA